MKGWLSGRDEIADYTGQSVRTIARWIADGKIPVRKLGAKTLMVRPCDLDRAIEKMAKEFQEVA